MVTYAQETKIFDDCTNSEVYVYNQRSEDAAFTGGIITVLPNDNKDFLACRALCRICQQKIHNFVGFEMTKAQQMPLRLLDLFAGGGGLVHGLTKSRRIK